MSHECEDCGQKFETLSRLRLHDCTPDETAANDDDGQTETSEREVVKRQSEEVTIEQVDELLPSIQDGEASALHQVIAIYETRLRSAHEAGESDRYRSISRTYREQLITVLDDATQAEGWEFLAEFLDAYHPETANEFPHVTTILQNVTSRYLIRTRISDDVETIPDEALGFFRSILTRLDEGEYDFITEGMHPYGGGSDIRTTRLPTISTIRPQRIFSSSIRCWNTPFMPTSSWRPTY